MSTRNLYWKVCQSPVGELTLIAGENGLSDVIWDVDDPAANCAEKASDMNATAIEGHALLDEVAGQIDEWFSRRRQAFDIPLEPDPRAGPTFTARVLEQTSRIPHGQTRTYGEIAALVGSPGAARAVGQAVGRNPIPIIIPCHRVLAANGAIGGFSGGLSRKRLLLDLEAR